MYYRVLRNNHGSVLPRLLAVAAFLLALSLIALSQQPSGETKHVTFAYNPDLPPYSYLSHKGEPTGFVPDVLKNLEKLSVYRFDYVAASPGVVEMLRSGKAGLGAVPKLDSLPPNLVLSHPINNIQYGMFRLSDRWEINSPAALSGHTAAYCGAELDAADVKRLNGGVTAIKYDSVTTALEALVNKEVDAAILGETTGMAKARELGFANRMSIVRAVGTKEYCLAGTSKYGDLVNELDEQLLNFTSSASYATLTRRYLSPVGEVTWLEQNWKLIFFVAWPLVLVLLGVWLWSRTLRRIVADRTAELRASESRYRQLVEDSPDGILITDGMGIIVNCSDSECTLLGYHQSELIGKHARRIMDEGNSSRFFEDLAQIKAGNEIETFANLTRKDGTKLEVWRKGVPLSGRRGRFSGAVFYDRDLTERRLMEQELYRERDFTNAVIDTSAALVMVLDNQGVIVRMNPACEQACGYSLSELAGSTPWDTLTPPAQIEGSRLLFYKILAGHWPMESEEVWQRKDGLLLIVAWSYTVIVDDQNSISFIVGTGIDVTEKRRAESTLAVEQRKHEQVINATSEGFWMFDSQFRTTDMNESLCRMLGYTRDELLNINPLDLVHPGSRLELERQIRLTPTTAHRSFELELIRREGSILPVAVEASTMQEGNGARASSFMFLRDISQQKLNEVALQRSETLHRKMFESNESVHLLLDAESTRIIDCNQAAREYLGDSVVPGAQLAALSSMEDEQFIRIIRRLSQEPTGRLFFKLRAPSGELREVESHLSRIDAGERNLLYAILFDVTNRRRSEEKLRRSEERLNAIFNHAAIGISLVNRQGKYTQCNDTWCQMTGYNPDELYNMSPEDLTHPDDRERTLNNLRDTLEGTKNNYRVQKRYVRKNGSYFWADVSVTVIRNTMGGVEAVLGVATDITDTKQSEYERERLIEDLSRAALEIKTLKGLLPICASCKKIRDDSGYWQQIEGYVKEHSEADFTHSICPECTSLMYPDLKTARKK